MNTRARPTSGAFEADLPGRAPRSATLGRVPNYWKSTPVDLVRGGLIGTAEVIPGVSGGTVALVTGVYDALIGSAGHLVSAVRLLVTDGLAGRGLSRVAAQLRQVSWGVIVPVLIGMAVAFVTGARVLEPVLEHYPEGSRAVFGGLILASVIVPLRALGGRLRMAEWLLVIVGTAAAAVLTGFPPGDVTDPSLFVVAAAAAVAVCALVLPGPSGSFLLLTFGLYAPTIAAVNDRDMAYLASFAAGAVVGLSLFVKGLQWLLAHRRRVTLALMAGLMIGSLRALWPWQTDERVLLAPSGNVAAIAALAAAGIATVLILVVIEHRVHRRRGADGGEGPQPGAHEAETATHPS